MTDVEIETQRVAGDITLVLKHGTESEKQSLLRVIEEIAAAEDSQRINDWLARGMPDA